MSCGGSMGKKKMAKGGQALNKAKGFAKSTTGGSNVSKNIFGVPNAGPTGPNRTGTYDYQKGGAFAPNRAVQASCKGGMVRDENGRCVMARKMAAGGTTKTKNFAALAPPYDEATYADKIAGATKKMKSGGNWIQGAIKRPGAFSAKAKAAGMSTAAYAAKVTKPGSKASTLTKRQANLAKTLGKMRKK